MEDDLSPEEVDAFWQKFKPMVRQAIADQLPIRTSQLEIEVDELKKRLESIERDLRSHRKIR